MGVTRGAGLASCNTPRGCQPHPLFLVSEGCIGRLNVCQARPVTESMGAGVTKSRVIPGKKIPPAENPSSLLAT